MAVKPNTALINFTPADGNYPYGSAKDETVPAALDGSEYKKIRADDVFGMQQALLIQAGIVPSGTADTVVASQYLQSILHLVLNGSTFVDSGAANVYVLTSPISANASPVAYKDGQKYVFKVNVTNTGASTVNVSTLGVKNIKILGADPVAGDLKADRYVMVIYNLGLDRLDLIPLDALMQATTDRRGGVELADNGETQSGASASLVVTPAGLESKTATESRKGIAETATQTETNTGTDDTKIVTPKKLKNKPGTIIQMVTNQTGAFASGGGTFPNDDTIPQISEGNEVLTLAITPTKATNKLVIEAQVHMSNGSGINSLIVALFQDAVTNALVAMQASIASVNYPQPNHIRFEMVAGTIAATTFRARIGGAAGTTYFNGVSGARKLGGVMNSYITIQEIAV